MRSKDKFKKIQKRKNINFVMILEENYYIISKLYANLWIQRNIDI